MKKRILILLLTGALLGLSSCGTDNYSKKNKKSVSAVISRTV